MNLRSRLILRDNFRMVWITDLKEREGVHGEADGKDFDIVVLKVDGDIGQRQANLEVRLADVKNHTLKTSTRSVEWIRKLKFF